MLILERTDYPMTCDPDSQASSSADETTPDTPIPNDAPRILVVEDSEIYLRILEQFLKSQGYRALTASRVQAAIDIILNQAPDLVITDVNMPDMNAIALLRLVQSHADPSISRIPVLCMSGMVSENFRQRYLEAGAKAFLTKPTPLKTLLTEIQSHLYRS